LEDPAEDKNTGLITGYAANTSMCNSRSMDIHHVQVPVLRRKISRRRWNSRLRLRGLNWEDVVADPACT
jgi:hypothetical protein